MKKAFSTYFKRNWREYVSVIAIIIISGLLLMKIFALRYVDLDYPLMYYGADDMTNLLTSKLMYTDGQTLTTDKLGAPYGTNFSEFSANLLHNVENVFIKIFTLLTGSYVKGFNLAFLSTFVVTALISYYVMRQLKINNWIAVAGSIAFGFNPFALYRGILHMVLTECYFIPLSILLCVWIYEDDNLLNFGKGKDFFKYYKNYLVIIFALLIANNGIAYYPFFTCMILCVTAVSKMAKTKKFKVIIPTAVIVGVICVFLVIALLPQIIYVAQNGANTVINQRGGAGETEIYSLKPVQMFIPLDGHGIKWLTKVIEEYNASTLFLNENISSYIGIMAIIGFVILAVSLFVKRDTQLKARLGLMAELNVILIIFGAVGGLNVLFVLYISDQLRSFNRISVFICYISILGFCMFLDYLYKKIKEKFSDKIKSVNVKRILKVTGSIVIVGFGIFCVVKDNTSDLWIHYGEIMEAYDSDDEFVSQIEDSVSEGAMIFQLPYHPYPEEGAVNEMQDYALFTGYLHSETLRWSYGCIKGREGDKWYSKVASLSTRSMITEIKRKGFEGIYIDTRAYTEDEFDKLRYELETELKKEMSLSNNGNLAFIKL